MKTTFAIVALFIAAATACYFTSDVFKAWVDSTHRTYTEWTPENVVKNPELYFDQCEVNARERLEQLRASEITTIRETEHLKGRLARIKSNVEYAENELEAMHSLYSDASTSWPVMWKNRSLDREEYMAQALYLRDDIKRQNGLAGRYGAAYEKIRKLPAAIAKSKADVQGELADIVVQRDMLKVQRINDRMAEELANIRVALDDVSGLFGASSSSQLGVDDLVRLDEQTDTMSDEEFKKAMGW